MPFDATTKELIESRPEDWLQFVGLSGAVVRVVDADVSTVTAAADKALLVSDPTPWLAHLELQASRDPDLPERDLQYNVLLRRRHRLPVRSIVVLLRPQADGPELTGTVEHHMPNGRRYLWFDHLVVRVWEKPVESVLAGGLGTLPLAPLSAVTPAELPGVIRRIEERIDQEATTAQAGVLWTATFVLTGLRYPPEFVTQLLQGLVD
jgi:predicted transposase YdaD